MVYYNYFNYLFAFLLNLVLSLLFCPREPPLPGLGRTWPGCPSVKSATGRYLSNVLLCSKCLVDRGLLWWMSEFWNQWYIIIISYQWFLKISGNQ